MASSSTASSTECGIDTTIFTKKVLEMFFCKLCHLVLKEPVQISGCGHFFCNTCFLRYQKISSKGKRELLCPVDQKAVAFSQVLPSEETKEFIDNLDVYCINKGKGCAWEGCYKEMEPHLMKCQKKDKMEEVLEKMQKMEEKMKEREKDFVFLKNDKEIRFSHNLKQHLRKHDDEIAKLKLENEELKVTLNDSTNEFEERTATIEENNETLRNEVTSLRNELKGLKTTSSESQPPPSQVYFDISIDNLPVGRIVIDLLHEDAPNNCRKIIQLCKQEPGWGYKGEIISVTTNSYIAIGFKVWDNAISSGHSTEAFQTLKENLTARHKKGAISITDHKPEKTTEGYTKSALLLCREDLPGNDGTSVIFGHVTDETWDVAEKIWEVPRDVNTPKQVIKIEDSGVVY